MSCRPRNNDHPDSCTCPWCERIGAYNNSIRKGEKGVSCHPIQTINKLNPRPATPEERAELEGYLFNKLDQDEDQAFRLSSDCYAAVWDCFVPDGPGYIGKVMVVIYPGGPECVECFTWDADHRIQSQTIDF